MDIMPVMVILEKNKGEYSNGVNSRPINKKKTFDST